MRPVFTNPTTGMPCSSTELMEWARAPMTEEEISRGGFRYGIDGTDLWGGTDPSPRQQDQEE